MASIASLPLTVSAHHHLKHDFFVYDTATHAPIVGALVTAVYDGGVQAGDTQSPHGDVMFRLPGRFEYVEVIVDADGY